MLMFFWLGGLVHLYIWRAAKTLRYPMLPSLGSSQITSPVYAGFRILLNLRMTKQPFVTLFHSIHLIICIE
jgi:hypothetical protein